MISQLLSRSVSPAELFPEPMFFILIILGSSLSHYFFIHGYCRKTEHNVGGKALVDEKTQRKKAEDMY